MFEEFTDEQTNRLNNFFEKNSVEFINNLIDFIDLNKDIRARIKPFDTFVNQFSYAILSCCKNIEKIQNIKLDMACKEMLCEISNSIQANLKEDSK